MPRKPKVKLSAKTIEQKYYGSEPIITGSPTTYQLVDAFNYYNYLYDVKAGKKWLLDYLKKSKYATNIIRNIASAPDWKTPATVCWMARLMLNGTILPAEMMRKFEAAVTKNAEHREKDSDPVLIKRIRNVSNNLIGDVEEQLDINPDFDLYSFFISKNVSQQAVMAVREYYSPALEEVMSNDPQVKEGYGSRLKLWQRRYNNMISDCDRYANNKKSLRVRKPRTAKLKTSADLIKNLKYCKTFAPLKLISIDPQRIIGATQLWVYNTKYRTFGVYNTNSKTGFSVKGTTLIGYDSESSKAKKLRKPEEQLKSFFDQGKVGLRTYMSNINTAEGQLNGRINEDTILLRVA